MGTRSIRGMAGVAIAIGTMALFAGDAAAACEQKDFLCEAKTVCVRSAQGDASWFPRPPGPRRPRPPRPGPFLG